MTGIITLRKVTQFVLASKLDLSFKMTAVCYRDDLLIFFGPYVSCQLMLNAGSA